MSYQAVELRDAGVRVLDCEHRTPRMRTSGHPYIAIPDVVNGRVDLKSCRLISDDDLREWTRRTTPQGGDIIVTRRGRVGDTAPVPVGLKCAIGQNLVLLRSDGQTIDASYIRWATRSPQWWLEVNRLTNVGAVFSSLNVADIGKIRIPVPPLPVQQAIAEVLGALDDKIASDRRQIEKMIALRHASYTSIPAFATTLVSEITKRVTIPQKFSREQVGPQGLHPVFDQSDSGLLGFTDEMGCIRASDTEPVLYFGDHTCKLGLASEDFFVGPNTIPFVAKSVPGLSLFHGLLGLQRHQEYKRHWSDLMTKEILVPSPELSDRFELRWRSSLALQRSLLHSNRTLANIRDTLLPQLMLGKLRVRDAERTVSEVL